MASGVNSGELVHVQIFDGIRVPSPEGHNLRFEFANRTPARSLRCLVGPDSDLAGAVVEGSPFDALTNRGKKPGVD